MDIRTFTPHALKEVLQDVIAGHDIVGITTTVFRGLCITARCNHPNVRTKLPESTRIHFRNVLNQYSKHLISDSQAYHKICDLILENCKGVK